MLIRTKLFEKSQTATITFLEIATVILWNADAFWESATRLNAENSLRDAATNTAHWEAIIAGFGIWGMIIKWEPPRGEETITRSPR